jgi:hypothetical protein
MVGELNKIALFSSCKIPTVLGKHFNDQENESLLPHQPIPILYNRLYAKSESSVKFNQSSGYLYSLIMLQEMAGFRKTVMRLPFSPWNLINKLLLRFATA